MQTVLVINKAVEVMKRGNPPRLLLTQSLAVRMKVPLQGHRPNRQAQTFWRRVAIAGCVQQSVQMIEQAVYSVRGARRLRAIVGRREFSTPPAELLNHFGDAATEMFRAPLSQAAQALREFALGLSTIDMPDTRQNLLPQLACATSGDLDHRVQVAQDQCDLREEQAPSFAGRRPAISTDREWAIVREDCFGLGSELAVGGLQAFSVVPLTNGDAQKAATGGRGRDNDFLTVDPGDLFINDQIARHGSLGLTVAPTRLARPNAIQARYQNIS